MARGNTNPPPQPAIHVATTANWSSADWLKILVGPVLGAILGVAGAFITMEIRINIVQEQIGSLQTRLEHIRASREREAKETEKQQKELSERIRRQHEKY